jgi:dTDP-4-dehydrorhamnose 3,5-epimerase
MRCFKRHNRVDIKVESKILDGIVVLVPDIFQDSRGFFMETYCEDQFKALGLPVSFCSR